MTVVRLDPPSVPHPNGLYSMVSVVAEGSRLAIIAGQTGRRLDGTIGADSAEQTTDALARVFALVSGLGAQPGHIAHLRTFLVGREAMGGFVTARAAVFATAFAGQAPPTNTLAFISGLADAEALVEIGAVVAVPISSDSPLDNAHVDK
jgi:enamine deaminase RidA (YjgF/YER057c/UK114 family)